MAEKKPSGAANRRRKREEEARARAEHAARVWAGLEGGRRTSIPRCDNPTRAHLWCVERMVAELHDILTDEGLEREKRWKLAAELTRAIGMLQTKADLEREVEQLRQELELAQDELRAAREAADRRAMQAAAPAAPPT